MTANSNPKDHGDQPSVQTPPHDLVAQQITSVQGAFDMVRPSPTPGYIPSGHSDSRNTKPVR